MTVEALRQSFIDLKEGFYQLVSLTLCFLGLCRVHQVFEGVCCYDSTNATNETFTRLHKHLRLPKLQSPPQQWHPGRRACRAGCERRRCPGSSVFPPGWAEGGKGRDLQLNTQ